MFGSALGDEILRLSSINKQVQTVLQDRKNSSLTHADGVVHINNTAIVSSEQDETRWLIHFQTLSLGLAISRPRNHKTTSSRTQEWRSNLHRWRWYFLRRWIILQMMLRKPFLPQQRLGVFIPYLDFGVSHT